MHLIDTRGRRRSLAAASALIALFGIAAVLTAATRADTRSAEAQATPVSPFPSAVAPAQASAAQTVFRASFAALRAAGQAIPATSVIQDPGVDRADAHALTVAGSVALERAGAATPDARLWATSREDGTECLLAQPPQAQGPAELCATPVQATAGYLLMTQSRSTSEVEIYGLVPDGVDAVTVTLRDGSAARLPVVQNAYAARFNQPTRSIAFTDASGLDHELAATSEG